MNKIICYRKIMTKITKRWGVGGGGGSVAVKEASSCKCKFSLNSKNEDHFYDGFTWVAMSHVT